MHGMCWNVYRIVIQDQAGGGGGGGNQSKGAQPPPGPPPGAPKIRGGQAPSPGSASVYMQFVDSELNG